MPTHRDLPDPDALRRLSASHEPPTAQGSAIPADPPPTTRLTALLWLLFAALCVTTAGVLGSDALYLATTPVVTFMDAGPAFPQALLYIALAMIPVTLIHELGHAFAARRLLGAQVSVTVGSIGTFATLELGRISVALNALSSPLRVAGSATFDASRARALDVMLIALAGPAASALGALMSLALLGVTPVSGFLHDLIWATALGGVFVTVLNLLPFSFQERPNGALVRTDGHLALDAGRVLWSLR